MYSLGLVVVATVGAVCAVTWPIAAVALALFVTILVLAAHHPALGFLGAVSLTGFEGVIKARFTIEGVPSHDALVAGGVDLLLLATAVNLLMTDRGRSLRIVWRRAGRAERIVWMLLLAWLAISVLQIPESGHLTQGIKGFRLVQTYVLLALPGVVLYPNWSRHQALTKLILWTFAIVAGYAALRAVVGPASWEESYALARTPQAVLGSVTRDIGSFASPQELVGFLAPAGAFAAIVGILDARLRLLAGVTFALSVVAVLESYVRIGLIALGVGIAVCAAVTVFGHGTSHRTKAAAFASTLVVVVGGYALARVAGNVSPFAKSRATGLIHPLSDESIQNRLHRWDRSLRVTIHHPLGTGLGTLGNATEVGNHAVNFTDNSYLEVLQEQGVIGLLFIAGALGSAILLGRRLALAGWRRNPLAVASLSGFAAFLTVCVLGEYIELPGKAVAWTLLGLGIWHGYGVHDPDAA